MIFSLCFPQNIKSSELGEFSTPTDEKMRVISF
jgi:hypothetical protein